MDNTAWLNLSKATTLQQRTVIKETWLEYNPGQLHSSDSKEDEGADFWKTFWQSLNQATKVPKIFKSCPLQTEWWLTRKQKTKGKVVQWIFHYPVHNCSFQGFLLWCVHEFSCSENSMPMVYHAAHLRLLRVLRSVCRDSFTVVIGEARGEFFVFNFFYWRSGLV